MCIKKGLNRVFDSITKVTSLIGGAYLSVFTYYSNVKYLQYGRTYISDEGIAYTTLSFMFGFLLTLWLCHLGQKFFWHIYDGFVEE